MRRIGATDRARRDLDTMHVTGRDAGAAEVEVDRSTPVRAARDVQRRRIGVRGDRAVRGDLPRRQSAFSCVDSRIAAADLVQDVVEQRRRRRRRRARVRDDRREARRRRPALAREGLRDVDPALEEVRRRDRVADAERRVRGQPTGRDVVVPGQAARAAAVVHFAFVVAHSDVRRAGRLAVGTGRDRQVVSAARRRIRVVVRVDAAAVAASGPLAAAAQRNALIVLTPPPPLNSETTSVSPSRWPPWKLKWPVGAEQVAPPCRNQNPTSFVPLLLFFSIPK